MDTQIYTTVMGERVTENMVAGAARLFNDNYGTWGEHSGMKGPVKLSSRRLRKDYLPDGATTTYTSVTVDGSLAGTAFACRWKHGDLTICWVTQLVVAKEYREMGLASGLLRSLRKKGDDVFGIMSSHPAAILAAAKSFGAHIGAVNLDFIHQEAGTIMRDSPIRYIKEAKLCGTIFNDDTSRGIISGVNTGFYVDHTEPLEALAMVRQNMSWPLGDLPEGCEFLLIVKSNRPVSRYRS